MRLIAELKRRNVFRVGAAYLALGWIVIQITGTVAPALHLPDWTLGMVVWVGAIGFPFALLFAWVYELTPEGLKRESEIDPAASVTPQTARRLDTIVIALLVVAIALFLFDRLAPRGTEPPPGSAGIAAKQPSEPAAAMPAGTGTRPRAAPDDKSIAVLPFVNMSEDKGNEFFADGISEELLNLLAKVPELRVIARTSSFAFKGKDVDISEIAQKLGVAHVLEGSVRKSGNTVRITAQLIRASDRTHLWSETYDRPLDDIFVLQDEIAGKVVKQLKVALLGQAPHAVEVNTEAYTLTLQAEHLAGLGSLEALSRAIATYERALALDPGYARALVGIATAYITQSATGGRSTADATRFARAAVNKALASDPAYGPAYTVLGSLAMESDADLVTAAQHYRKALELSPGDARVLDRVGRLLDRLGRLDEARAFHEAAVRLDPVNASAYNGLVMSLGYAGQWDEALANARTLLALSPGFGGAQYRIGIALLFKGDAAAALQAFEAERADEEYRVKGIALARHALGQQAEFATVFAELRERWGAEWPSEIAQVYAWTGDTGQAFSWLDRSADQGEAGLTEQFRNPLYGPLHDDPRWQAFRERTGTSEAQLAAIPFDVKLPDAAP